MSALGSALKDPNGVEIVPSGETGQYFYIPRVLPETAPDGSPAFLLLKTGDTAILQAGTHFAEDPARLDHALAQLKARQDIPIPIRLSQAPLEVRAARLVLVEGGRELATAGTSAVPPYAALFHTTLNGDDAAVVQQALSGTRGKLLAIYDFDLSGKAGASATVQGDTAAAAAELGSDASDADAAAWVDRALGNGVLKLESRKWGTDADILLASAISAARSKAAAFLLSMIGTAPAASQQTANVLSTVRLEEPRTIPASRQADVADWFGAGKKATILTATTTAAPAPAGTAVTVRLGFEDKDAPLAFIEVRGEGERVAPLRAPGWQPVIVNAAGKLSLTVHYTSSAPALVTEVAAPGSERTLAMDELGIALIRVDASARKAAGATQLRADVKYLRNGEEIDSWPVRFRFGDWTDQWYVVTSAPGLNGTLQYRWQETGADGTTTEGGPVSTDRPDIRIESATKE